MCNLIGMYAPEGKYLDADLVRAALNMQIIGSIQHSDGFGFFARSEGEVFTAKTQLPARHSIRPNELYEYAKSHPLKWMMLHIRRTSTGKVDVPGKDATQQDWDAYMEKKAQFAHPFVFDNLAFMHNGTFMPKDGVDYEMDSKFFAEQLSENLKVFELEQALDATFDLFTGGFASLLFAVKENDVWVPYILKGNKPLHRYVDKDTGVQFVITDKDFARHPLMDLGAFTRYRFDTPGQLSPEGVFRPLEDSPFIAKSFIEYKAPAAKEHDWTNNRAWQGYTPGVVTPAISPPKNKSAKAAGFLTGSFDEILSKIGGDALVDHTAWVIENLDQAQIEHFLSLTPAASAELLQMLEDKKYDEVKAQL